MAAVVVAAAARLRPGETRFVPELPWTATEAVPAEEVGRVARSWSVNNP